MVNLKLESKILSNVLSFRDFREVALDNLKPEYFSDNLYRSIFQQVTNLSNDLGTYDVSEAQILEKLKTENINLSSLVQLTNEQMYFQKEYEGALRSLISLFVKREINKGIIEGEKDLTEIQNDLNKIISNISIEASESNIFNASNIVVDGIKRIKERAEKTGLSGLDTGYKELNNLFDGHQRGNLVVLAGRPAMGKTAFALQQFTNASKKGAYSLFFSLEMPEKELTNRILSAETGIKLEKLKKGNLTTDEWGVLFTETTKIHDLGERLLIDDRAGLNIDQIRTKVKERKKKSGLDIIFIDYLTIMGTKSKYTNNRNLEIGEITIGLKNLAKEEDICVVLLAQLSRSVEARGGAKVPFLSDLRDSGSIEQDADIIGFCYRPEYYGITQDEEGQSTEGVFMYLVKKNRNGENKSVKFNCDLSIQRIYEDNEINKDFTYPTMQPNTNVPF